MKKQNTWMYFVFVFVVGMAAGSVSLAYSAPNASAVIAQSPNIHR
jgi:hypothetical protein